MLRRGEDDDREDSQHEAHVEERGANIAPHLHALPKGLRPPQ